jgi:hypothetical protein
VTQTWEQRPKSARWQNGKIRPGLGSDEDQAGTSDQAARAGGKTLAARSIRAGALLLLLSGILRQEKHERSRKQPGAEPAGRAGGSRKRETSSAALSACGQNPDLGAPAHGD